MATLTVKLSKSLDARFNAFARKRGASKSALAREAIEALLKSPEGANLSVYDLADDLCGIVKDGPTDLATNPKYMDGFGE